MQNLWGGGGGGVGGGGGGGEGKVKTWKLYRKFLNPRYQRFYTVLELC